MYKRQFEFYRAGGLRSEVVQDAVHTRHLIRDAVQAGDVIGYMGRTGYSATEDVNNIDEPHLHFGIQLIFDESQKEGNSEIWIDCYQIVQTSVDIRIDAVPVVDGRQYSHFYHFVTKFAEMGIACLLYTSDMEDWNTAYLHFKQLTMTNYNG